MARFRAYSSDEDEDDNVAEELLREEPPQAPSKAPSKAPSEARPPSLSETSSESSSPEDDELDEPDDDEDSIMDDVEIRPSVDSEEEEDVEAVPWPQQLNLEPQRVHVMQTSLFRMPELANAQSRELSGSKHPRADDTHAPIKDFLPRHTFAEPRTKAPSRKYLRVNYKTSVTASREGSYIDAGLSFGRSFRVGWGPGNKLVCAVGSGASSSSQNTSIVNITTVRLSERSDSASPDLLSHLLSNTPISPGSVENQGTPSITPGRALTFASFASLFTPSDRSHEGSVFRLGHALFDPLDLHLPVDTSHDIRNRVNAIRRTETLSSWLTEVVAWDVEEDLKKNSAADSAKVAFLHLTGNQVERAVDALINGGDIRLATLISQVPGDAEFRGDTREQLHVWKDEKVDAFMSEDIRKLYALAAGTVDTIEGGTRKETVGVGKGLDWLRAFGLRLWYSSFLDTPLQDTFADFEQEVNSSDKDGPTPSPWYAEKSGSQRNGIHDRLFSLMKLALSPSMTLESALRPLGFGPNPFDYKLPWFIYLLLSRCLRVRDFGDRVHSELDGEEDNPTDLDGFSATANALTLNYAAQLEQEGLVQEAIFVLLFLEDDDGRRRAVKEVLARCSPLLDDWNVAGIRGSLMVPEEWINEARATYSFSKGEIYQAFELYTSAGAHATAHDLAITYLVPEAILRDDLELLRSIFMAIDGSTISNWGVGGELFIDYANIISRVPPLRESLKDAVPDATEMAELESLQSRIPKLVGILPDVLRGTPEAGNKARAALSQMLSNLLECSDPDRPLKIDVLPSLVDEGAHLRHLQSASLGRFLKTIATAA